VFAIRWRWSAGLAVAAGLLLGPAPDGRTHDSLAPAGAPHHWLPGEQWVYRHWVPFDEQALKLALGLDGRGLEAFLYNDHHTLAGLARARGLDPGRLADQLVSPWAPVVDGAHFAVLRDRTLRLLTQGHLAQHVFFHVYHGLDAAATAPEVFGSSAQGFLEWRLRGASPLDIARQRGVSISAVHRGVAELFAADRQQGLRSQQAWPTESDRIMARQIGRLDCWSRKPLARWDPANPYGKQMQQHGDHPRGWPATAAEHRDDAARVEGSRRSLPTSCWRRPPAWQPRDDRNNAADMLPRSAQSHVTAPDPCATIGPTVPATIVAR
jgi:AraC-like DNA-binding protein